jgi:hypothetical protein
MREKHDSTRNRYLVAQFDEPGFRTKVFHGGKNVAVFANADTEISEVCNFIALE